MVSLDRRITLCRMVTTKTNWMGVSMIRFLSLQKPTEMAYVVHTDWMEYRDRNSACPVCQWAGFYCTYGDGIVQHSPDLAVQREMLADFCASLAQHLQVNPGDVEVVAKHWPNHLPSRSRILFLAGLRYKDDGKRRYFHEHDDKVSAAESKRHDKRWEEVPTWADGSLSAVMSLLNQRGYSWLHSYATWLHAAQVLRDEHGTYSNVDDQLKLPEWTHYAFEAVNERVQAFRLLASADRFLNCWKTCMENKKNKESA